MAVVAWGWRQRIRQRHILHLWSLRLDDWHLECVVCRAVKDERGRHMSTVPRADELAYVKENNNVLAVAQRVLKALAAIVTAAIASYGVAVADGHVTGDEWVTLVVAAIGAGLVVWAVPNREPVA